MIQQIEDQLDIILEEGLLGPGFEFRDGQRETVSAICQMYFKDPEGTVVIDAPTGTGKSIVAMASSLVLSRMNKTGYMVTSDLSLQDQYESDFYKMRLRWPSLKGVDNYTCDVNQQVFSLGDCKLKGMGYEQASKLHCYGGCEYLQTRKRAIESSVCLLNYSYWLLQRNYVADKMLGESRNVPFDKRDFVFFDEAHKVDELVQNHFTPRIDETIVDRIHQTNLFLSRYSLPASRYTKASIQRMVTDIRQSRTNKEAFEPIKELERVLFNYVKISKSVKKSAKQMFGDGSVPKDWQKAFTNFERLKDVRCKCQDYIDIIEDVGLEKMVINHKREETQVQCIEERHMIKKFLHDKAGFKVFMSATIGDPSAYMKIMGIENANFIRLGNAFNYDKSPIIFVNRHKLSYKEKEASLPEVVKLLDQIISKHTGQRGIVHCGSYEFLNYIKGNSKHTFRFVDYENSKEKSGALEVFKNKDGAVLLGPSLLEGLDLKDDTSRFQIFFKVPYPSLGDPLIKAKMNNSTDWYDWKTGVSILQGVGRSVRSKDDWAVTYILDSCFWSLMNKKDFFPPSFTERLKVVK